MNIYFQARHKKTGFNDTFPLFLVSRHPQETTKPHIPRSYDERIDSVLFSYEYFIWYMFTYVPVVRRIIRVKVPSTSSLSVYTKVLAHNLNDIRNWASLIGLLLRICWCLLSVFLIYCSDEWKKLVNLIYCFQVLFRMNFKIMYFLMKILGNTPSADSAASRDSLSSQNAT